MRLKASISGLDKALQDARSQIERATTRAMSEAAEGLKEELRDQTAAALGRRVAFAWRANVYPRGGTSLNPAALVYSRAPRIVSLFSTGAVIRPVKGSNFLWIPTQNVPRATGRRGASRRMTPEQVEQAFNADLQIRRGRNGSLLAFIDVVKAKSAARPGFRQATRIRVKGRKGLPARQVQPVLMFVLRRQVVGRKLIDLEGPARRWAAKVPGLIERYLERS